MRKQTAWFSDQDVHKSYILTGIFILCGNNWTNSVGALIRNPCYRNQIKGGLPNCNSAKLITSLRQWSVSPNIPSCILVCRSQFSYLYSVHEWYCHFSLYLVCVCCFLMKGKCYLIDILQYTWPLGPSRYIHYIKNSQDRSERIRWWWRFAIPKLGSHFYPTCKSSNIHVTLLKSFK